MMVEDFYHSNLFLVIGPLLLIGIIVSFIFNVIRFSTKKRLRVCGFGHPLLDITTHVDSDFLDRYGLKPADTMLAMDHHKPALYHELIDRDDVQYGPGGATLNSVRACQWLLRGKGRTGYVGCIGDDEFGELLKREVEKSKVEAALETIDDAPTGTCGCMILGKERCLVANLGASQRFSPNWFNRNNIREQLEKADIYFIAGFFLNLVYPSTDIIDNDPKLFPALYIAKHAAKHNKIFCMNLSAPYLCTAFKDKWEVLMPYIDYLFGSEVDYLALSEAFGWKVKDIHEILERCVQLPKLNSNRPRIAVVTRGALPTVVRSPERFREYPTPFVHLTHIQDLNGAGDAFVGGFLAVLASGGNINECMRTAQYTASQVIRQPGCTFPSKCRFSYSLLHFITDSWRDHVNGKL